MSTRTAVSRENVLDALRREPRRPLEAALETTLEHLQASARSGRGVLADLLGRAEAFAEWEHYPPRDALDPRSGYRFYYHAHDAAHRARDEHGHFHVFAPRRGAEPEYAHLFGLSVDARGMPLRVFSTNRWVTAERWQDAAWTLRALRRLDLSAARPRRVASWLQGMARLFAPQIQAVVLERDLRIAQRARRRPLERVLEDRRSHIVSQCPVDLARQFEFLQAAGIA